MIAIREAISYIIGSNPKTAAVITDSQSALLSIQRAKVKLKIGQLEADILNLLNSSHDKGQTIYLIWAKGHSNTSGNDIGDYLAKKAAYSGKPLHGGTLWSHVFSHLKSRSQQKWANNWAYTSLARGSAFARLKPFPSNSWFSPIPDLSRNEIVSFTRIRIKHTCDAHFYRSSPNCSCSPTQATPHHLLFQCPFLNSPRKKIIQPHFRDPPPSIEHILKNPTKNLVKAVHQLFIRANIKI